MNVFAAHKEIERQLLIVHRLGLYVARGCSPSPEALQRILDYSPDQLRGEQFEARDLAPREGERILIQSGCGGESPHVVGSAEYEPIAKMYGDRMKWRSA